MYTFEVNCKIRVHRRHRERTMESLSSCGMPQVRDVILRASRSEGENRSTPETAGFSRGKTEVSSELAERILDRPLLWFRCRLFSVTYNMLCIELKCISILRLHHLFLGKKVTFYLHRAFRDF